MRSITSTVDRNNTAKVITALRCDELATMLLLKHTLDTILESYYLLETVRKNRFFYTDPWRTGKGGILEGMNIKSPFFLTVNHISKYRLACMCMHTITASSPLTQRILFPLLISGMSLFSLIPTCLSHTPLYYPL